MAEVPSPSTVGLDRVKKLPLYGAYGVAYAWLLDPVAKTLEVFAWRDDRWTLTSTHEAPGALRAEPFEAVELDLSDVWLA